MILYEDNRHFADSKVILEEAKSILDGTHYWRTILIEDYNLAFKPAVCTADTLEELKIWCDLHKMNVISIYPLDMHKEIYGETVVI